MPILLVDVSFGYRSGPRVVSDATVTIHEGETLAFVGPSGSGKTTMLNLIGGLLRPTAGVIERSGPVVPGPDPTWVFQTPLVFAGRSVVENVAAGLLSSGLPTTVRRELAMQLLDRLGLGSVAERRARTLSGGQLQRVSIARALVGRPSLILADEPTGELDRSTTRLVVDTMLDVRSAGSILVFATHDEEVAGRCDRRIAIEDGRIREIE